MGFHSMTLFLFYSYRKTCMAGFTLNPCEVGLGTFIQKYNQLYSKCFTTVIRFFASPLVCCTFAQLSLCAFHDGATSLSIKSAFTMHWSKSRAHRCVLNFVISRSISLIKSCCFWDEQEGAVTRLSSAFGASSWER
jgi:hypothetical protein